MEGLAGHKRDRFGYLSLNYDESFTIEAEPYGLLLINNVTNGRTEAAIVARYGTIPLTEGIKVDTGTAFVITVTNTNITVTSKYLDSKKAVYYKFISAQH